MKKLILQLYAAGGAGMKKLICQLHVIANSGAEWLSGAAAACLTFIRAGRHRQRACSLLMVICMIAGLLSPISPFIQKTLAAAAAAPDAGATYYFDLSAEAIPGTINTALPDTTLHYVPFVYAGPVNVYSLRGGSSGNTAGSATAAANTTDPNSSIGYCSDRTLFVADYSVSLGMTWDALNNNSLIFGRNYQGGKYLLRAPSGGSAGSQAGTDVTPAGNEWSVLNTAGRLNNMGSNSAWVQDTYAANNGYRVLRGQSGNAAFFSYTTPSYTAAAYRPVLENLKADSDLSAVTLHLNGGSFNKSTGDVKIICSGASYTAPSSTGLVRPVNNTLSGFYWNTAKDGSGTSYAEGATVPSDVTELYAQWKPEEQFSLPAGQTYYFDMSEDKVTLGGTTNAALPDTSRHYVPFTYVGTINAYRLSSNGFKSGTGASATAANNTTDPNSEYGYRYDHSLFISQYNVINSQSCNVLAWTYSHNGNYDNGKYRLRMPTGGYTSNSAAAQTPLSNEWDQILNKSGSESNDGWIKNWSGIWSFVQDFYSYQTPTVTRTGYTFKNWYTTPGGSTAADDLGTLPTADKTYYAQWTINQYTVTLNLNGGNISGSTAAVTKSGDYGTTIDYTAPVRAGYTFKGWAADSNAAAGNMSPTYTTDTATYYAVWTAGSVTVTFEPMGGTFAAGDTGSFTGKTGETYTAPASEPIRTGYTFQGWFTQSQDGQKITAFGTFPETSVTYYAQWKINQYTVTLLSPDGTPDTQTLQGSYGDVVSYTIPVQTGYSFGGWKARGSTDSAKMFLTIPAEDAVYEAVWVTGENTVTYDANGGVFSDGETGIRTGSYGKTYTLPAAPTRTGCDFAGWYTTLDFTTEAPAAATFPPADVTYYAKWTPKSVTITLNAGTGATPETQTLENQSYGAVLKYVVPTKTGFAFIGWKVSGTDDNTAQMFLNVPAASTDYESVWLEGGSVVTFDPMGGTLSGTTVFTGKTGETYAAPASAPTRTGYIFDGWYDAATGGNQVTDALGKYPNVPNTTYFARWTANSVKVTLDPNGGQMDGYANTVIKTGAYGDTLSYTMPVRSGYTFSGWKLANEDVSAARTSLTFPSADTTYVAVWTANSITVTFDANGGTIGDSDTQAVGGVPLGSLTAPTPTRSGYDFAGWFTSPTVGTRQTEFQFGYTNAAYYAHWTAGQITVTMNDGTGSKQYTGYYGTPISYTMPTRAGSTFTGWKISGADDGTANVFPTYPAAATTFEAVWTVNQVTLNFNTMGGTFAGTETGVRTGAAGSAYTAIAAPTRSGYTFGGWFTDAGCTNASPTELKLPTAANTIYYAKWTANGSIKVTLNAGGGTFGSSPAADLTGTYGEPVNYTIPTLTGYTFMGWKLTGEPDAAARLSLTFPADTATYYAVWAAGGITVTFDANGGTLTGTGIFAGTTGGTYAKPADPERTGYTFDAWYTATTGGSEVASFGVYPSESVTYYAHWNANTVTVKLDPAGGKIGNSAGTAQISGTFGTTVDYGQMTKDGCQFVGWKLNGSADITAKRSLTFPAADAQYTAVWTDAVAVSVKYSANGGELSGMDTYTGTPGETWTAPDVAARPGYAFLGWGLDPFGTAADHQAGVTMTYTTQAFTAYYALWQATGLTITLDPNGGKFGDSSASVDKTGTIGQQLIYTIPSKTGFAFAGWAETDDAAEGNMFPTFTVELNGKTLYAVWKANAVSTAFFAMGGSGNALLTGNIGSHAVVPADPQRTGYTFEGWYTEQNGSGTRLNTSAGGNITLAADTPAAYYAKWTANNYIVTLDLNGGNISGETADVTINGVYGAPVNYTEPTLDGYTFTGWKTDNDTVTRFITFPAEDTAYIAQWQVNTVTVTFNPMNGESTTVLTGNSGTDMTVPAAPVRTGYTFDGWSLQPVSTGYAAPANVFPTASIAYYAQWTAKKVTVTMKLNEGTVNDKKGDVTLTGSYGAVVAYPVPVRSGYTFSGWKLEGGKDEDAVLYLVYQLNDAVYEAVWKAVPAGGGGGAAGGTAGGTLVTVPVSSDEGNTHAAVSIDDGTAVVSATEEQIKEVISGTKETGTVVVNISNLSVSSAIVPAALISAAQTAEGSTGLTVALPTGSVTLDKTALDSAGGNDVKIEVQPVDPSTLNDAQKEKLGEQAASATIIDVSVYVNNVLTHTFNDGKVYVSVPYILKSGESADSITVWYLADNGSITPMHGVYDPDSRTVSFTTTHLSSYVIASFPFKDVSEDAWHYGSVAYAYTHGIFAGTADTTFSPEQAMTRGMIVTVLWRMAGEPSAAGTSAFRDVASGAYYAQAVAWAAENGIVLGYGNGNYGPDDGITREQMAAILYRYAKFEGYDVSAGEETNILSFDDVSDISEYAIPAFQWACGAELIQGSSNRLMPGNGASRAQAAAILTRFCQNIAK